MEVKLCFQKNLQFRLEERRSQEEELLKVIEELKDEKGALMP